ncbi:MAG: sulfatase [Candidatus Zipacnadales bacterium]
MDRPNILLIVSDSVRFDRCSCYGYERSTTPVLEQIAVEGIRFDAAYSESSWTVPVMLTLLTGIAPREHRGEQIRRLVNGIPSLPELLKTQGYTTYAGSANPFFGPNYGVQRGFDHFFRPSRAIRITKPFVKYIAQRFAWTDNGGQAITYQFERILRHLKRPWFALLWYFDAHSPYAAKQPFLTQFARKPLSRGARNRLLSRLRRPPELVATAAGDDLVHLNDLYDAAIAYEDRLVGRLRQALEQVGIWDETWFVFTADHGEMLGERGLAGHGRSVDLYEPVVHVPLVMRGPGLPQGQTCDALVQLADVTQTLAAIGGVGERLPPTAADRIDLRDAIDGAGRAYALSEREPFNERSAQAFQRRNPSFDVTPHLCEMLAVVADGWKLIRRTPGREELYHLAEDPTETIDRLQEAPDRKTLLEGFADRWLATARPHPAVAKLASGNEVIVEKRLQDLGYF